MRMIPDTPYGTDSRAEKRVFDRLRMAFNNDSNLVAYHSINLTRHAYKRFGEIDFLICGREGLFVLEVKGGRIACHDGTWSYTNRFGAVSTSREGPFRQVESALHGLLENLCAHLPDQIIRQFIIGFGMVFPDCEWRTTGAEWDPHTLADARDFRDFEAWLRKLFRYWRHKHANPGFADDAALKALRRYLRPEFEAIVPLHVLADQVEDQLARLTEDQMALVDVVAANPRVLCAGGAGTGKTFLAIELARRWTAESNQVLLACRSPWLRRYLEVKFAIPGLIVALASSVQTMARRAGIDKFDALIVDEGQDLFDMESLDQLDGVLKNGLSLGRWCIFHDANQQSGLIGKTDQDAVDYLLSLQPTRVPLRTNCRNTRLILETVQQITGADMGTRGAGTGPKVRHHLATSAQESADILAEEITEIVDHGGLASGCLTILSAMPFAESSAALLTHKLRKAIIVLDEYSLRNFPPQNINFSEIAHFKGLENEAVIVIDLPEPDKALSSNLASHYVAMSRARAVLSLVFRKPVHDSDCDDTVSSDVVANR